MWEIETNTGRAFTVRYLVTAVGILHKAFTPDFPGLNKFARTIVHSSQWTPEVQYAGKRVGVIGSGASGVQVSSSLYCPSGMFRRSAQTQPERFCNRFLQNGSSFHHSLQRLVHLRTLSDTLSTFSQRNTDLEAPKKSSISMRSMTKSGCKYLNPAAALATMSRKQKRLTCPLRRESGCSRSFGTLVAGSVFCLVVSPISRQMKLRIRRLLISSTRKSKRS